MSGEQDKIDKGWQKLLDHKTLKSNLINASLYLAAWESLRNSVIDQLKQFYQTGLDEKDESFLSKYQNDVLSLDKDKSKNKSPLRASKRWLLENGAINAIDHDMIDQFLKHRNEIAHNVPQFVASNKEIDLDLLDGIIKLIEKIDKWWILYFHVPTNPDYDDVEVDESEVSSGRMMILHLMISIATGEDEP